MRSLSFNWLVVCLLCAVQYIPAASREEVICGGFYMRDHPKDLWDHIGAKYLLNCTVIEGDVRIAWMKRENNLGPEEYRPFPAVREITGHLLVSQAHGLDSLGRLFPNLRLIRGSHLFQNYALVVYQNPNLKEIGLHSLTEISNGGIGIQKNPELCFADSTNWLGICREKELSHVLTGGNKDPLLCDTCANVFGVNERCWKKSRVHRWERQEFWCWNNMTCQEPSCYISDKFGEKHDCLQGCYWEVHKRKCCNDQCAGGCSGPRDKDCYACRSVFYEGHCLKKCPPGTFLLKNRRCVTEEQCKKRLSSYPCPYSNYELCYKPMKEKCDTKCPKGLEQDLNDPQKCAKCQGKCAKHCFRSFIREVAHAKHLQGCTMVESLTIQLLPNQPKNISDILAFYLKDVREIKEYIVVQMSEGLRSLDVLKSIEKIHGDRLHMEQYALSVVGNDHLAQLFNQDNKLDILRGSIQFQNNPMLCFKDVSEFARSVNITLTETEASLSSNGYMRICESKEIPIKVNAKDHEGIVLSWEDFNLSSLGIADIYFIGYKIFYKEVKGCDKVGLTYRHLDKNPEDWSIIFEGPERGVLINKLKADTCYAVYVEIVIVFGTGGPGAISEIHIFKTEFGAPSPPRIKKIQTAEDSIMIEWLPSLKPNSDVSHYKIQYGEKKEEASQNKYYCARKHRMPENGIQTGTKVWDNVAPHEDEDKFESAIRDLLSKWYYADIPIKRKRNMTKPPATPMLSVNVTDTKLQIKNLKRFTLYEVKIWACQNKSVEYKYCSRFEVGQLIRTKPSRNNDVIPGGISASVLHEKSHSYHIFKWSPPPSPNGQVLFYEMMYTEDTNGKIVVFCFNHEEFTKAGNQIVLERLPVGNYKAKVRAFSLAGYGPWSAPAMVEGEEPPWITPNGIVAIAVAILLTLIVVECCRRKIVATKTKHFRRNFRGLDPWGTTSHSFAWIATATPKHKHVAYSPYDSAYSDLQTDSLYCFIGQNIFMFLHDQNSVDLGKFKDSVDFGRAEI